MKSKVITKNILSAALWLGALAIYAQPVQINRVGIGNRIPTTMEAQRINFSPVEAAILGFPDSEATFVYNFWAYELKFTNQNIPRFYTEKCYFANSDNDQHSINFGIEHAYWRNINSNWRLTFKGANGPELVNNQNPKIRQNFVEALEVTVENMIASSEDADKETLNGCLEDVTLLRSKVSTNTLAIYFTQDRIIYLLNRPIENQPGEIFTIRLSPSVSDSLGNIQNDVLSIPSS
jgi:hypothetical protein